jgi:3-(3-hydroxy-phenyl)propionate hydroxylase
LLASNTSTANGTLFPQPRVTHQGASRLLDDVAGHGLRLVLGDAVDASRVAALTSVKTSGAAVVQVGGAGWPEADGIVAAWFAAHGAVAALVRPDHYVYGVASTLDEIQSLAASYQSACTA